jgi:acetolactate synthase regulatory subunit
VGRAAGHVPDRMAIPRVPLRVAGVPGVLTRRWRVCRRRGRRVRDPRSRAAHDAGHVC